MDSSLGNLARVASNLARNMFVRSPARSCSPCLRSFHSTNNGALRALKVRVGPKKRRPRADKFTKKREPYEPVIEDFEVEDDDMLVAQSQDQQENLLLKQLSEGYRGSDALWPVGVEEEINVSSEFRNLFPSELHELAEAGLISSPDIHQADAFLRSELEKEKKVQSLVLEIAFTP